MNGDGNDSVALECMISTRTSHPIRARGLQKWAPA